MTYRIKSGPKKSQDDAAQLLTWMERFWLAAEEHRRGVLTGFVVLLLAAGVLGGVVWYDYQQAEQALKLDREAGRFYATRPSDNAKQAMENLKQAIVLYRRVVKEFPRSAGASHSLYQLGLALEEDNNVAGAIEAYEKFLAKYGDNEALLGLVLQRLGYAFLLKKDPDKAERAFSSVLTVRGALNKDHALFELGKLEETQARPEGAFARYQDLVDGYPHSPLAGEAQVRMRALGVKEAPEGGIQESGGESPDKPDQ